MDKAEQGRHQQDATVAILNVGGMHDGVHQEALRINEDMPLLAFDLLACIISHAGRCNGPFFRRLDALTVKDRGGRAGLPTRLLAALHIERFVKAIERAVIAPQIEIIMERRARRQILRNRPPLAARAQDIHQPVDHFALIDMATVAPASGRRDQRRNMRPFGIREVARVPQFAAVIAGTIFVRPH